MTDSSNKNIEKKAHRVAICAASLYLANLLLLPIIASILLLALYRHNRVLRSHLANEHMEHAIVFSFTANACLLSLPLLQLFSPADLILLLSISITWLTLFAGFSILGIHALAQAINGNLPWKANAILPPVRASYSAYP